MIGGHFPNVPRLSDEERLSIRDEARRVVKRETTKLDDTDYDWDTPTRTGVERPVVIHLHQEKPMTEPAEQKPSQVATDTAKVVGSLGGFLALIPPATRVVIALAMIALAAYIAHLAIPLVLK